MLKFLTEPTARILKLAYAPVGQGIIALVAGNQDINQLRWWSVATGEEIRPEHIPEKVHTISVAGRSDVIATFVGNRVRLHSSTATRSERPNRSGAQLIPTCALSHDGRLFAMCRPFGRDNTLIEVHHLDVSRDCLQLQSTLWPTDIAFSEDGRFLACAGHGSFTVWDVERAESILARSSPDSGCIAVGLERSVIAVPAGQFVVLWELGSGRQRQSLVGHQDRVQCLAFSPDGDILASGGRDRTVRLWDAQSGELLHTYDWQIGPVHAVAFAPDGLTAAAGGESGEVVVWDVDV